MKKPSEVHREPQPAMIAVVAEPDEPPYVDKEESLIRKPAGSRGNNIDEMIFGKKSGSPSQPNKDKPSKDDLISF
ncbi:target of Myb protein 1 [Artemisia annua]|uniref:Target of Myb protein 1 n=1 Tax=Artemisia annua TaxID=35608 RepID=A0A2U1Q0S4_ARTAN|nr:target of Myb protein 1 [Artemisia annua]